jgi:hypothetical protein
MTEKKARKIAWRLHFFNDLIQWFLVCMTLFAGVFTVVSFLNRGHPIIEPVCVLVVGVCVTTFIVVLYRTSRVARRYVVIRYANNDATNMIYALIEKSGDTESVVHLFERLPAYVSRHETLTNSLRVSIEETVNINGKDFHGHVFVEFRYRDQEATLRRILGECVSPHDHEASLKERCSQALREALCDKFLRQSYLYPPAASKELRAFLDSWKLPEDCSDVELTLVQPKFIFVPPTQEWNDEIKFN